MCLCDLADLKELWLLPLLLVELVRLVVCKLVVFKLSLGAAAAAPSLSNWAAWVSASSVSAENVDRSRDCTN